ncbi:MAG: hypothetical protein QOJ92_2100 [Frankiales bacterium]|nr:hypothetical protein [Frankiales bacterium]
MPRIILFPLLAALGLSACAAGDRAQPRQGLASPSAIEAPLPQVVTDCEHFGVRPAEITVACGDGNYLLRRATYDRWTAAGAVGHAVAVANDCTPNCAEGHFAEKPVDFRLDGRRIVFGVPLFTRLTVLDPATGGTVMTTPLLPLGCSLTPPSCPPSPEPSA